MDLRFGESGQGWPNELLQLRNLVERATGAKYNSLGIPHYPNGAVGLHAHKDLHVRANTPIATLSMGATRSLTLARDGFAEHSVRLPANSLYVLKPPTNDFWTHAIEKEPGETEPRFSFVFRSFQKA